MTNKQSEWLVSKDRAEKCPSRRRKTSRHPADCHFHPRGKIQPKSNYTTFLSIFCLSLSLSLFLSFFHFSFSFFLKGWGGPSDGRGESQCFRVLMPLWRQGSAPCWLPDGDPVVTSGQTHLLSPTHQHRPYLVAFLRYPRRSARNQQTITASKLICVGHRQSLAEIFTNSPE